MAATIRDQGTITKYALETHLLTWLEAFLIERKAQNMSAGTVKFYRQKLLKFADFCESLAITQITEITPTIPIDFATIHAMLNVCDRGTFTGIRDKALMFVLLDTGSRAGELLSMNLQDLDLTRGEILIREGKGRKPRMVY